MKMKSLVRLLCFLMVALFSSQVVASDNRLFKGWDYGDSIDSFPRSQGYYDCSADMGALALCKENVEFLSLNFFSVLYFNDDQTLGNVSLIADFTPDVYASVVGALSRDFSMVYMEGERDRFDFVKKLNSGEFDGSQQVTEMITRFESTQLTNGYLDIVYFEAGFAKQWSSFSDYQGMLLGIPEDVRAAEVIVYYNDVWGPTIEVSFNLPGKSLQRAKQQVQSAPVEDF